jgi:hypothetical protein
LLIEGEFIIMTNSKEKNGNKITTVASVVVVSLALAAGLGACKDNNANATPPSAVEQPGDTGSDELNPIDGIGSVSKEGAHVPETTDEQLRRYYEFLIDNEKSKFDEGEGVYAKMGLKWSGATITELAPGIISVETYFIEPDGRVGGPLVILGDTNGDGNVDDQDMKGFQISDVYMFGYDRWEQEKYGKGLAESDGSVGVAGAEQGGDSVAKNDFQEISKHLPFSNNNYRSVDARIENNKVIVSFVLEPLPDTFDGAQVTADDAVEIWFDEFGLDQSKYQIEVTVVRK